MAEAKFKPTQTPVTAWIEAMTDETLRDDAYQLIKILQKAAGAKPVLWAGSIIGFGTYHYVYDSGHEGDACLLGFAVRKSNITLYVAPPDLPGRDELLKKLGKHKASKACIYIKKLADINLKVLEQIAVKSVAFTKKKYPK